MAASLKTINDLVNDEIGQSFTVNPLPALGAEITHIDLSRVLNHKDFSLVRQAFLEHHLLVFREQDITPQQHINFSRLFGPLQIHVLNQFQLQGYPEILIISNIKENNNPIGLGDAGAFWHSDLSYKEIPSLGSLLYARQLPEEGGDTYFADMHLAWQTLPPHLKKAVEGRQAEHTYIKKYAELQARSSWRPKLTTAQLEEVKPVVHPVVTRHPDSGLNTLFVNENFTSRIIGLPQDESDDLLAQLFAHSIKLENVYVHKWQDNDLVFWDNRSVIHLAAGTPDHLPRKMYRTTVEGTRPLAA
ncbi:MAG: TauD/TfdA family dioxygenase [Advenella sp.]|uniref:TauD/TfdA dioxygenase family protein n=1 Tax=Advenella sp. TaxID=1872388 RepID=UPI0025866B0A|nr:TauD/TfdA family dioxygenase [Advenella sp.]MDD3758681.1 TauD/TfdA family dioxygenase [Advenella sp.]